MNHRGRARAKRRAELVRMFGPVTVMLAELVDPESLTLTAGLMERVWAAADALLARSGQPEAQMHYVAELPNETRLVLTMWLLDLRLAGKLAARAAHG